MEAREAGVRSLEGGYGLTRMEHSDQSTPPRQIRVSLTLSKSRHISIQYIQLYLVEIARVNLSCLSDG